ncbi:SCO family protein [Gilvimarinus agarilyticus]|uniref:SCO family protein n=1 Tax=Gilvimarinus agarilyticus TaxID=679259 RepID=UPI0005A2CA4B|nr:SCO family protein [Gilvimarinus agarilyticus]
MSRKKRRRVIAVLLLAASAFPASIWVSQLVSSAFGTDAALTVTPFSWVNSRGDTVELASVESPLIMLFMGYLSCDSACPARLGELVAISRELSPQKLDLVFITLDPVRDTAERREALVEALGIATGVMQSKALSRLRFELRDRQQDIANHSTRIYVLTPAGRLVTAFSGQALTVQDVKQRLHTLGYLEN